MFLFFLNITKDLRTNPPFCILTKYRIVLQSALVKLAYKVLHMTTYYQNIMFYGTTPGTSAVPLKDRSTYVHFY